MNQITKFELENKESILKCFQLMDELEHRILNIEYKMQSIMSHLGIKD